MVVLLTRRILSLLPLGIGIVTIVSLLIHLVPGDPVDTMLPSYATAADRAELRQQLGLDQPVTVQIARYFGQLLQGNLGNSILTGRPVTAMLAERYQATIELALISMLMATLLSVPLGIISALRAGKITDYAAMGVALLGVAIPNFWLGPMLILWFSLHLDWLPVSERGSWDTYILPAITLGTALAAVLSRMTRTSMLETLGEDYVRTARAKGVSESQVIGKHALRNASLPLVTIMGLQFGVLLTGAIITERIFDWPGLGTLMLEGIQTRDYPIVQGCVLAFSATYLAVNTGTDLLYAAVDPRVKVEG